MKDSMMALYEAMPKGYGVADACVKIGQSKHKDGTRKIQLFSEDMSYDWWTKEVSRALIKFVELSQDLLDDKGFGAQMSFDDTMDDMRDITLDVELNVLVTKITNWVFLVSVMNHGGGPVEETEENPKTL